MTPVDEPHTITVERTRKGWRAKFDVATPFEGAGPTPQRAVRKLYEAVHLEALRLERLKKSAEERRQKTAYYSENEPYISRLPDDERKAVTLYFRAHRSQSEIGARLHMSQAAVAVKLKRAQERIDFMRLAPDVTAREIRVALTGILDPRDVEILATMAETSSQSETSRVLGLPWATVRGRYVGAIKTIRTAASTDPKLQRYEDFFYCLKFNILRAVPSQTARRAERLRAKQT